MASNAQPVKISWLFPIEAADMGKIRPDVENESIRLLFASAEKADAFFQKFPRLEAQFSRAAFQVERGDASGKELTYSIGQSSIFGAICALHDTMKNSPAANVRDPYRFTLID